MDQASTKHYLRLRGSQYFSEGVSAKMYVICPNDEVISFSNIAVRWP